MDTQDEACCWSPKSLIAKQKRMGGGKLRFPIATLVFLLFPTFVSASGVSARLEPPYFSANTPHLYTNRGTRCAGLALCALFCLVHSSCDLESGSENCCAQSNIEFRYTLNSVDQFDTYISTMQYFLFDENGAFLFEMEPDDGDLTHLCLCDGIPNGTYSLVALANLDDYATIDTIYLEDGLTSFRLDVTQYNETYPDQFDNGDKLYWGQVDFTLNKSKSQTFICQMANIHCVLTVRVEWEGIPSYSDGYRYVLDKVGTYTELHEGNASTIGVQQFPLVPDYSGSMTREVSLRRGALQSSLYTLRITNDDLPVFRLYHYDDPVTPEIDLAPVFSTWRYHPSLAQVQDYEMLVTINRDGSVSVDQGLSGSDIADWADGGSLG